MEIHKLQQLLSEMSLQEKIGHHHHYVFDIHNTLFYVVSYSY